MSKLRGVYPAGTDGRLAVRQLRMAKRRGSGAGSLRSMAQLPEPAPTEITETDCRQCGTRIAGLDGRYACPLCGWVNGHSEGHHPLPPASDDPDGPANR
jgi:hypothetical protein